MNNLQLGQINFETTAQLEEILLTVFDIEMLETSALKFEAASKSFSNTADTFENQWNANMLSGLATRTRMRIFDLENPELSGVYAPVENGKVIAGKFEGAIIGNPEDIDFTFEEVEGSTKVIDFDNDCPWM